jgi:hypothetical protein
MTSSSTAVLSVSPKHVGAWGDSNLWRIAGYAQLVEHNIPYWLVTQTQPAQNKVKQESVTVETPHTESVVASIIMLLAVWFGDKTEELLVESHNLTIENEVRGLAPYWELADSTQAIIAKRLASQVRLGLSLLDETSLVNVHVVERLRMLGFDVTVFVSAPTVCHR